MPNFSPPGGVRVAAPPMFLATAKGKKVLMNPFCLAFFNWLC